MKAKKKYGQNFLHDKNILSKIISKANINQNDYIIEIGTGHGALTRELDKASDNVISYEIDKEIFESNKTTLSFSLKHTKLLYGDFLKTTIPPLNHCKYRIIANIPYYITTPIIEKIIENKELISDAILMVQKEYADRIIADAGSKEYSSFTLFSNYHFEAKKLFKVSRNCFTPAPKVDSAIIQLKTRENPPVKIYNETLFFDIIHASFWGRRKTILSAIKKFPGTRGIANSFETALKELSIDPKIRGEKLSLEQFASLANHTQTLIKQ